MKSIFLRQRFLPTWQSLENWFLKVLWQYGHVAVAGLVCLYNRCRLMLLRSDIEWPQMPQWNIFVPSTKVWTSKNSMTLQRPVNKMSTVSAEYVNISINSNVIFSRIFTVVTILSTYFMCHNKCSAWDGGLLKSDF